MDDYGTGYSNLANLMSNNYKTVKIDKSLLWKATDKAGMASDDHGQSAQIHQAASTSGGS